MNSLLSRTLILLFLFISLVTCKHKCEKDPDSVWCPGCKQDQSLEGMKDYFFFKTGTWWVYREETSGALDTVTVFFDNEVSLDGQNSFEWRASSTFFEYNFYHLFEDTYSSNCLTDKDCDCRKLERAKSRPGDYIGGGRYFTYPIIIGNSTSAGGVCKVIDFKEIIQINDSTFHSAVEYDIEVDGSAFENGHHTRYLWAKKAGIVDFRNLTLNTHWTVISYHTNQ